MNIKYIGILIITVVLFSCNSSKSLNEEQQEGIKIISGSVESTENGKDGYTATVKTKSDEVFYALVSIPNIGNAEGYKVMEISDAVTVKGDFWKLGDKNQLTVRKILSTDNRNFKLMGKVQEIEYGVDGYTATVESDDEEEYGATISIPNLGSNHEKYRDYKVGESIHVVGELWLLGDDLRVTVRDIID